MSTAKMGLDDAVPALRGGASSSETTPALRGGVSGSRHHSRQELLELFRATRAATERLAAPLSPEDQQLQSMPAASPTKWHRAHTSWFFEKALLEPAGIAPIDPRHGYLFNSYYESFGPRHARAERGLLSRPSADEVAAYRAQIDAHVCELLAALDEASFERVRPLLELGIAHEEQHQELILTDILHAFSRNPLEPAYKAPDDAPELADPVSMHSARIPSSGFIEHPGGLYEIGADTDACFAFDCELPRHKRWLEPFELGEGLVTIEALKAFMRDGGYRTASLWLAEGFDFVRAHGIEAPLYMRERDGVVQQFGLRGPRIPSDDEPVAHLSYYEADALARYLGARLPSEAEWELGARDLAVIGSFVECGVLYPVGRGSREGVQQLYGEVWQWTSSSYEPYPGYRPMAGAIGEYNGKFMVNQHVLRGGSCLTPARHVRVSYRNFWHPETRFQMTGVRLARDVAHHGP